MRNFVKTTLLLASSASLLAGCLVGPNYRPAPLPQIPEPNQPLDKTESAEITDRKSTRLNSSHT